MKRPSPDQSEGFRSLPGSVVGTSSPEPLMSLRINKPLLENTNVWLSGDQTEYPEISGIPEAEVVRRLRTTRPASSNQISLRPPVANCVRATRLPSGDKRNTGYG